jgi:hypothetical protein
MDLLTNAVQSIRAGVQDYQEGSHARLLTAVRSIHAGIILLYKESLRRLSPSDSNEVLIKGKILPSRDDTGKVVFVGQGRKTVDVQQIRERFHALGITTDWARFERITNLRNDIEHYYTRADKKALESVISDAFVIVRNFTTAELNEDPRALLEDDTWQVMLEISDVHEAERKECEDRLRKLDWGSEALQDGVLQLTCGSCGSTLLRPSGNEVRYSESMTLECRICGEVIEADAYVGSAIAQSLGTDRYRRQKDGEDDPYTSCPVCGVEAYVVDEQQCAHCGESVEHNCERCGVEIPTSELHCSPLCGYCEYMLSKDD